MGARPLHGQRGKLPGLNRLVAQHYGALEADFAERFHLNLAAVLWRGAGADVIPDLPTFSRLVHHLARRPDTHFAWSLSTLPPAWRVTEELIAISTEVVASRLDALTTATVALGGKRNRYRPKPFKFERPYDAAAIPRPRRQMSTAAEVAAFRRR